MFKKKIFEYNGHQIRQGADLSGADLSGLVGREVAKALGTLRELNFTGANLTGANFDGLELMEVDFTGANLTSASLIDCWLPKSGGCFRTANFTNAKIKTAWNITVPDGGAPEGWSYSGATDFSEAKFDGASLSGWFANDNFDTASFRMTRFDLPNFFASSCRFRDADFTSSHFDGKEEFDFWRPDKCFFYMADLTGAKFHDVSGCAYFHQVSVYGAAPEFKVLNGVLYLDWDLCGDSRVGSRVFEAGKNPWAEHIVGPAFFALTPEGLTPDPSFSTSESSSVESELAEVKRLLDDGLIDQAEHDALRRKILGI